MSNRELAKVLADDALKNGEITKDQVKQYIKSLVKWLDDQRNKHVHSMPCDNDY